jgi:hypothetical protein
LSRAPEDSLLTHLCWFGVRALSCKQRRFSWQPDYLDYPFGRSLPVLSGFSLAAGGFTCRPAYTLQPRRSSRGASVTSASRLCLAQENGTGILNRFSIGFALRLHLRSRLTLIRLALIRNPWVFGGGVSHPSYRYSCLQFRFRPLQPLSQETFCAAGMLPYLPPDRSGRTTVSVVSLMPANYRRRGARPVSYYALFQGMAASKPTSWLSGRPNFLFST